MSFVQYLVLSHSGMYLVINNKLTQEEGHVPGAADGEALHHTEEYVGYLAAMALSDTLLQVHNQGKTRTVRERCRGKEGGRKTKMAERKVEF